MVTPVSRARANPAEHSGAALGRRIAYYRGRRGFSQRDLGALVGRSESWVSQVERGARGIDRMSVLRAVAEAVRAPIGELIAETPLIGGPPGGADSARDLRLLLSAGTTPWLVEPPDANADVTALIGEAVELVGRARYEAAPGVLVSLISAIERDARAASPAERVAHRALSSDAYAIASTVLRGLGDATTAWVAADRAAHAAERAHDPVRQAACAVHLARALREDDRLDQAEHTARRAIRAIESFPSGSAHELHSVVASLWLELALVAACRHQPQAVRAMLDRARTAFTRSSQAGPLDLIPADVVLTEIAASVELGEATAALRHSTGVVAERLDPARAVRLKLDLARAHLQRGDRAGVLRAVLEAEQLSPHHVRAHHWVHSTLRHLLRTATSSACGAVQLAARCGVAAGPALPQRSTA